MYLDREEGITLQRPAGSRRAAADAVEAKAPLDPEILRRWRSPDSEPETEAPDERQEEPKARHSLPAVIEAPPARSIPPEDKPKSRPFGGPKLMLLSAVRA